MLEIKELTKVYLSKNRKITALHNVSFDVKEGEVVALLGPNGAGKTTLIKCATGLVIPDNGDVKICGYSIRRYPQKALKNISVVLEGDRNLFFRLTGYENIYYFLKLSGKKIDDREIKNKSIKFGLHEMLDKEVRYYSKGMRQKLSLLISILSPGTVVLLDEPTTGLDVFSSIELRTFIKNMAKEGKAVLIATHEMHVAEDVADKVAILNKGKLLAFEHIQQFKDKHTEKIYKIKVKVAGTDIHTILNRWKYKVLGHNVYEFEITEEGESLPSFMQEITKAGGNILELKVDEPNLEKIFVSYLNIKEGK